MDAVRASSTVTARLLVAVAILIAAIVAARNGVTTVVIRFAIVAAGALPLVQNQ
ncbi:uncharacterized protein PHACADRAFT_251861 [Phanerochaete carnosa HHB-10118-sp]|uniref:Uncharacterized protein n=1 Tax=Phanerochaete carnosa (strain HHB-10118-sp) TaxID=650164 RepID=K5WFT7_PHACS|nr:uncharacterized protein PHACADRAFT_251861 [Phanerochaete carnosa HHB-10118-sp]EKM57944.1 hypothetical protein PHACADRAFT_251861 [Phanerochaete carnosa HHB-10118-sp]